MRSEKQVRSVGGMMELNIQSLFFLGLEGPNWELYHFDDSRHCETEDGYIYQLVVYLIGWSIQLLDRHDAKTLEVEAGSLEANQTGGGQEVYIAP